MTPDQFLSARLHLGMKQDELAETLGISESSVANYERGRTTGSDPKETPVPRSIALAMAALCLGVTAFDGVSVSISPRPAPPLTGRGTGRKRAA